MPTSATSPIRHRAAARLRLGRQRESATGQRIRSAGTDQPRDRNRYAATELDPYHPDLPRFARPASNHSGGVNVVFADGHTHFLRDDIDYLVYQRLLTTNGKKCVDPEMHEPAWDMRALRFDTFRTAPVLSETDY